MRGVRGVVADAALVGAVLRRGGVDALQAGVSSRLAVFVCEALFHALSLENKIVSKKSTNTKFNSLKREKKNKKLKAKEIKFKKKNIPIVKASKLSQCELIITRITLLTIAHHMQNLLVGDVPIEQSNESVLQGGLGDGEGIVYSESFVLGLHTEVVKSVAKLDFLWRQLLY